MKKSNQIQRLTFLFAVAGLAAVTADFACLEDVCAPEPRQAALRTIDDVGKYRIETLDEGLVRSGVGLTAEQRLALKRKGQLFGVVKLDRPVKHPNGAIEMPNGWLPEIADGHPWRRKLTPADDAFYSFVEERIIKAKLYDPTRPDHREAVGAYLQKASSPDPSFIGWTYIGGRTECRKKVQDSGPPPPPEPDAQ